MPDEGTTLKQFIVETIWSIHEALNEVQSKVVSAYKKSDDGTWNNATIVAPPLQEPSGRLGSAFAHTIRGEVANIVQFDVAVVAGTLSAGKAGVGLFVAGVGLGGQRSGESRAEATSRIQFAVPVVFPNPTYHFAAANDAKAKVVEKKS